MAEVTDQAGVAAEEAVKATEEGATTMSNTIADIAHGNFDVDGVTEEISEFLATYGLQVVGAIIILVVGWWVARFVSRIIERALRGRIEPTLASFFKTLTYALLLAFVIIATLEALGVATASFIAVIGAAGLAIGFALQGSLANLAAGVMILIFRPFKAEDFVEVAGTKGVVKEVHIFHTILYTPDNLKVIVPNNQITSGNIVNYTANGTRRVDLVIGVSYDDDLKKTKEVISSVLSADDRLLKEPSPTVAVSNLGDSSVDFVVRPWVNAADYWAVYFDLTEKIKVELESNGISIPYPQRDIHIKDTVEPSGKLA